MDKALLFSVFTSAITCLFIIVLFFAARKLNARFDSPLLNPLLVSILILSLLLILTGVSYEDFASASLPIHLLLEIAVVALAYPLYTQFHDIKRSFGLLCVCSFIGVSSAAGLAFLLCQLFSAPEALYNSLMALSVTTPITLIITDLLAGLPAIAAVMVILIGMFGAVFGLTLLSLFKVSDQRAKGIALGVVCHGVGTATAMEHHPQAGAFASASMIISALITALWVPILYAILTSLFGY
ncbi:hypothetical protein C1E23_10055 [Pseudoalteromonas phenolica]|uniref:LrgB family protein n=1 Tax=Pseudoalteromonas phenolica TaxID=161398 RepID=A0A4Q7IM62_9GAMM|nr:LrgB family protein [Pseudoalteromonas phenolica]RZQ53264.1 hypothetical protein C1E23_10055 [Pseudoalteromonas phenolica]